MNSDEDPTVRRRMDREAMNGRDEEVWRRRRAGQSFRQIGRALGMAVSSVQRCYQRALKRSWQSPLEERELDAQLRAELEALGADTAHPESVELLAELAADPTDELARYRLRHLPRRHGDDWEG